MTRSHFFPTGRRREAGKQALLRSFRQLLTKGLLAAMSLVALLGALLLIQQSPQAFASQVTAQMQANQAAPAIQSRPAINDSYYMTSGSTSIASSLGCDQGKADKRNGQRSHVILDFGAQVGNGSGTTLIATTIFRSNKQIEGLVEAFARGYSGSKCIGKTRGVTLGVDIGTNNSGSGVSFANGKTWAKVVLAVKSYLSAHHLSSHVTVFGANDIESWCQNSCAQHALASSAIQWARGYHSAGAGNYVNFGSLDGCPPEGSCEGGWTTADYWSVSNRSLAWVVPQIYNQTGAQAKQWEQLDLYSVQHHHSNLVFLGPLDQHNILPHCCPGTNNTAQAAWNQLWSALHSHKSTAQKLLFSIEIRWEPRKV